jgi:hypothetical protein
VSHKSLFSNSLFSRKIAPDAAIRPLLPFKKTLKFTLNGTLPALSASRAVSSAWIGVLSSLVDQ